MKRINWIFLICLSMLFIYSCTSNDEKNNTTSDFEVYLQNSSIGSVNEDNFDLNKYSYTLFIKSGTKVFNDITATEALIGEQIKDIFIEKGVTEMNYDSDYLEVKGFIVIDSKNLSKEQIVEISSFIDCIIVTLSDGSEISLPIING